MKSPRTKPEAKLNRELRFKWSGRFDDSNDVGWHEHVETELVVVRKGRCRIEVGDKELEGSLGAVFVLPSGIPQYQSTFGPTLTTFVGFQAPAELFDDHSRVLSLATTDPVFQWMEQLCDWQLSNPPMSAEVNLRLLEVLLRRIGEIDTMQGTRLHQHPAVSSAITYLEQNLIEPLQLQELANRVG